MDSPAGPYGARGRPHAELARQFETFGVEARHVPAEFGHRLRKIGGRLEIGGKPAVEEKHGAETGVARGAARFPDRARGVRRVEREEKMERRRLRTGRPRRQDKERGPRRRY